MHETSAEEAVALVPSRHLDDEIRELDVGAAARDAWSDLQDVTPRHTARTLVKQPGLRVLLLVLRKGSVIPEHTSEGDSALHVLSGRIALRVDGEHHRVKAGHLIAIRKELAHEVEALEDSEVLLTMSWPP